MSGYVYVVEVGAEPTGDVSGDRECVLETLFESSTAAVSAGADMIGRTMLEVVMRYKVHPGDQNVSLALCGRWTVVGFTVKRYTLEDGTDWGWELNGNGTARVTDAARQRM